MKIILMLICDEKVVILVKMVFIFYELVVEVIDEGSGRIICDVFVDLLYIE